MKRLNFFRIFRLLKGFLFSEYRQLKNSHTNLQNFYELKTILLIFEAAKLDAYILV